MFTVGEIIPFHPSMISIHSFSISKKEEKYENEERSDLWPFHELHVISPIAEYRTIGLLLCVYFWWESLFSLIKFYIYSDFCLYYDSCIDNKINLLYILLMKILLLIANYLWYFITTLKLVTGVPN